MRRWLPVAATPNEDAQDLTGREPSLFGLVLPGRMPSPKQLRHEAAILDEMARRAESEQRAREALTGLEIARDNSMIQRKIQAIEQRVLLKRRQLEAQRQEQAIEKEQRRLEKEVQLNELADTLAEAVGVDAEDLQLLLKHVEQRRRKQEAEGAGLADTLGLPPEVIAGRSRDAKRSRATGPDYTFDDLDEL
jgi:hypothetical protein